MHYKNGREAKNGDTIIGKLGYPPGIYAGIIHNIQPQATTCNCTVARVIPGGVEQVQCVTVGDLYNVEDAFTLIETELSKVPKQG